MEQESHSEALLHSSPDAARAQVQEAIALVESPDWPSHAAKIATTVLRRQLYDGLVPPALLAQLDRGAASRYPGGPQRWRRITGLVNQEDVNRCIKIDLEQAPEPIPDTEEMDYPQRGWIGDYLPWCRGTLPPTGFHFWSAVAAISCACRRTIYTDMGGYRIFTPYMIILTGRSGTGKGVALNLMADNILGRLNTMIEDEREEKQIPFDKRLRLLQQATTPEYLISSLRVDGAVEGKGARTDDPWYDSTGAFIIREFGSLLGEENFHRSKLVDFLLDVYDCPAAFDTGTLKRGQEVLYKPAITLIGGTTPRWIRRNLTEDLFLEGLIGRFVFVYRPRRAKWEWPRVPDPLVAQDLAARLLPWALGGQRQSMTFSSQARAWYEDFSRAAWDKAGLDAQREGYYSRMNGHVLRLAMILSISEETFPEVALGHLETAAAILDHEEQYVERCFNEIGRHPDADNLGYVIGKLRVLGGDAPQSELNRRCHSRLPSAQALRAVLQSGVNQHYLQSYQREDSVTKRKSMWWRLTSEGRRVDP